MDSPEFLRTAEWTPLDPSLRTWERSVSSVSTSPLPKEVSRDSMGAALPLSSDTTKLSGVLDPADIRHRFPAGMPELPSVTVDRSEPAAPTNSVPISARPKKGIKMDVNDPNLPSSPR